MRFRSTVPVGGLALLAVGLGLLSTIPSHAEASPRYYFWSEDGRGYAVDYAKDPHPGNQVGGSKLRTAAPTATTVATAQAVTSDGSPPSGPTSPTFELPFAGVVDSLCVDAWVKATMAGSGPGTLTFSAAIFTNVAIGTPVRVPFTSLTLTAVPSGEYRFQGKLTRTGTQAVTLDANSRLVVYGVPNDTPDWALQYNTPERPSSVVVNSDCGAAPGPSGSPSNSPTPSPTGSPSPGPSGSPSVDPSPTVSVDPCATPSPSATSSPTPSGSPASGSPSPSPSDPPEASPPPEACDVKLPTSSNYTGLTEARHGEPGTLRAVVTTEDGAPVPTGTVRFTIAGRGVTADVDEQGVAAVTTPFNYPAGNQVLLVEYLGGTGFAASSRETVVTITQMASRCRLTRAVSGGRSVLTATLRTATNRPIAAMRIAFRYDGRGFKSVVTNSGGSAKATAGLGSKGHRFSATFAGTDDYTGCSATVRV